MSVEKVVFEKFSEDIVFVCFFEDDLDFETKVKYFKEEYGDNFNVFNNAAECITYIKKFLDSSKCKPYNINSFDDIDSADLISDKKFYVLMKFDNAGKLFEINFNSEDGGIFGPASCPEKMYKHIFNDYVKPYLKDKFYITINGVKYEQEITEELVSEKGVKIDKLKFKLVELINGKFTLCINGKDMTRNGKEIKGECNTPYTLNSGKTCITVELKH